MWEEKLKQQREELDQEFQQEREIWAEQKSKEIEEVK